MSGRFPVSGAILNWLPKYSGKGYEAFYKRFPKYGEWIAGSVHPTICQIQALATFSNVPLGYIYLKNPPQLSDKEITDFRRLNGEIPDRPYSPELRDTIYDMQIRQDWLSQYRKLNLGIDALSYVGGFSKHMDSRSLVHQAYSLLNIEAGWQIGIADPFTYIRERIEAIGVTVFVNGIVGSKTRRKLSVDELIDSYAPIIFINGADSNHGRLFTIIHEFCHILLGEEGVTDSSSEPYCNSFAGEFLVPESRFIPVWNEHLEDYETVAKRFKVSEYVIYRIALEHGYITRIQYHRLVERFNQRLQSLPERETRGGGDFYVTAHARLWESFSRGVVKAARAGELAYRDAYELLGLRGSTFTKYVNEYSF